MNSNHIRFWSFVAKTTEEFCWKWSGAKCSDGYGNFTVGGKNIGAHRYSWELHFGSIPKGISILHKCDNPDCVNPNHLFMGTQLDNMHDCINKGRNVHKVKPLSIPRGSEHWSHKFPNKVSRGSKIGNSVLDEEIVRKIKILYKDRFTIREICDKLLLTYKQVYNVISGACWCHIIV